MAYALLGFRRFAIIIIASHSSRYALPLPYAMPYDIHIEHIIFAFFSCRHYAALLMFTPSPLFRRLRHMLSPLIICCFSLMPLLLPAATPSFDAILIRHYAAAIIFDITVAIIAY